MHTISQLPPSAVHELTWRRWFAAGLSLLRSEVIHHADTMARWSERTRERRALMALDERTLSDLGLSRSGAVAEYDKPFWQD